MAEKLDIKVGEIWEVDCEQPCPNIDKEIIYVNKGIIAAVSANNDADREHRVYTYNEFGEPRDNQSTAYRLKRKKPEKKAVEFVRYLALFHDKKKDDTWAIQFTKIEERLELEHNFIKWIEIKESFEVEV